MGTKTISIMEDVYKLLLLHRTKNESFSDVLRRMFHKKKDIMEFAGSWKDISDEIAEDMKNAIKKLRKKSGEELLNDDMYRQ